MPGPFDHFPMLFHRTAQAAQGAGVQPMTLCDGDLWPEPEFRFATGAHDVDMGGFAGASFVRVKEEPKAIVAENRGHGAKICRDVGRGNGIATAG